MICIRCGSPHSNVIYIKFNEKYGKTERRRECENCGLRFTTHEEIRTNKKPNADLLSEGQAQ